MARSKSGSVYERRPGVWECRVTVAGQTMRSVVHGTEDDAWGDVSRMEAMLGRIPKLGRDSTLRDVWAAYRRSKGQRLATKTMYMYEWHMERLVLPEMGDRLAWSIERADVQRLLLTEGWSRDRASRVRRILSAVLSWAEAEGYVPSNPARGGSFELPNNEKAMDSIDEADDPFAAIEGERAVWGAGTVMECFRRIHGLALEPCWLACVGAGLRVEEALALRKVDVRRIKVGDREVTQVAVHHARTDMDSRKATKTSRSVRVVALAEPFGERLWEIADALPDRDDLLCPMDASNQNRAWRLYFAEPPETWHKRMGESRKCQGRLHGLPYLSMGRMRATNATLMQAAGVAADLNAAAHGHSEAVSYAHYKRPDTTEAAQRVGDMLTLVS